jgi:hypothetical protein
MWLACVLVLTTTLVLVGTPRVTHGGGRVVTGHGRAPGGSSSSISTFSRLPRAHRHFGRTPFGGAFLIPWDSYPVLVPEAPVERRVMVQSPLPSEPPVADPKFVFPPSPTAPGPPGSHAVIIQRGSRIEVESFAAER